MNNNYSERRAAMNSAISHKIVAWLRRPKTLKRLHSFTVTSPVHLESLLNLNILYGKTSSSYRATKTAQLKPSQTTILSLADRKLKIQMLILTNTNTKRENWSSAPANISLNILSLDFFI